ncbi:MAG: 30S ribosomal protein S20 [Candidatus Eisenbacteria bacterium]|uniref:Small ribosomal subunit protein bS20 n=1 Tax=Eiseniibacteriota bacterium TaxID=2212470 RepID=A0A933SE08_UNCEI|nr:30S ribosomal protein S20 [Candidatus Eisenbacteria bacterium]
MPHHKSAAKRVVTNEKRRLRNIAATSRMRTAIKAVRSATTKNAGEAALHETIAVLDRTAAKGIIKRETASRHKSRLSKFVAKLPA